MRTLAVLLVFAIPAAADIISPSKMKVGDVGQLAIPPRGFIVSEVGDTWIAVRFRNIDDMSQEILVRGVPTAGLVDDRQWQPPKDAVFKVVKTEKYRGKTVFSLQVQKE
jgi:hypothetical protein